VKRLAAERLGHERGIARAVVEPHLRPWVLKMRTDAGRDAMRAVIGHRDRSAKRFASS